MSRPPLLAPLAAALMAACLPASAQYKVVGSDGSVTYTDRPPVSGNARVIPLGRNAEPAEAAATPGAADAGLPFTLRQVAARYPVTLYTSADCPPCDAGRRLLQQRGIPYTERSVQSQDDAAALERAVGGRTVPALTVGTQALRGLSETDWTGYLDAAGYPRRSQLPPNWKPPAVTPLVARVEPPARAPTPAPAPPVPAAPPPPAASGPAFRF
jgi:glutaredoxin